MAVSLYLTAFLLPVRFCRPFVVTLKAGSEVANLIIKVLALYIVRANEKK